MIGFVRGKVIEKHEGRVVVETTNGVGYRVMLSPESEMWRKIEQDSDVELYISHQFRENEQVLYGFGSPEERNFFEQLKTVSGVGPKLAAALLAHVDRRTLAQMILNEDIDGIATVPGIGKKMSERLIVDLRDKVLGEPGSVDRTSKGKGVSEEVLFLDQALERLGFNTKEREGMLDGVDDLISDGTSVEDILKQMLSQSSG